MVIAKEKFIDDFSSWCNLRLKFIKITSGFTLTEQWEAGNYHIIFWSVTSKAEFSSGRSASSYIYIFNLCSSNTPRFHILQDNGTDI